VHKKVKKVLDRMAVYPYNGAIPARVDGVLAPQYSVV